MINKSTKILSKVLPLRALGLLIIRHKKKQYNARDDFFLHPLKKIETHHRDSFLLENTQNRRVLHFGFLDHPITEEKIANGNLLHAKLKTSSSYLFGVDVNSESLNRYREITGDLNNSCEDYLNKESDVSSLKSNYEVVLFPEVLEHLKNPGIALDKLREISQLNSNCKIIITVPNAFSFPHFQFAIEGTEAVHPDHYCYYSPVTLEKLLTDCGFRNIEIHLYAWGQNAKTMGLTQNGLIAICNG